MATGLDKVYITTDPGLVEKDRLLPLAMASDIRSTKLSWSGHYLVNPWNGEGLVDLTAYPRLSAYLAEHRGLISKRHVGKKNPGSWFRTIDRVNGSLTTRPKLYLPDFKERIAPVLDTGTTYPHHNVYFIYSDVWDQEVLGGLLLSDVAQFFIEAYGVKMRGGYFRFQAQFLRRIRVPYPSSLTDSQVSLLREAFDSHNVKLSNMVAKEVFHLSEEEGVLLEH